MSNVSFIDKYQDDHSINLSIIEQLHVLLDSFGATYVYAASVAVFAIISINLPAKLIYNDAVTRSVVHWITTIMCAMAGIMLSTAVFTLLPAAFDPFYPSEDQSISQSGLSKHHALYVSIAFLFGLMNVPMIERCLLLFCVKFSSKISSCWSTSETSDYDEASSFLHQNQSTNPSASSRLSFSAIRSSLNLSNYQSTGHSINQSTLLPVPDYRRARDLTQDDPDDFVSFDLNDRDQLSPPLLGSRQSLNRSSNQSMYHPPHEHVSIDANSFLETQQYLARCAYCKDKIHTRKGLAYHGAGCELLPAHSFDFNSSFVASLRGKRGEQAMKHSLTPMLSIYISVFNQSINMAIVCLAFVNFSSLSVVSSACYLTSLMCYQTFIGLCLGFGFQQQRCRSSAQVWTGLYFALLAAVVLVISKFISDDQSIGDNSKFVLSSLARAYAAGEMLWVCLVDCVLEEMERRDVRSTKWPAFVICGLITALVHWME